MADTNVCVRRLLAERCDRAISAPPRWRCVSPEVGQVRQARLGDPEIRPDPRDRPVALTGERDDALAELLRIWRWHVEHILFKPPEGDSGHLSTKPGELVHRSAKVRTPTGLPRSARTSCDREGRPLDPRDHGADPDRGDYRPGACRFAAASPRTPPYFPSTGISLNEASTRVQAIRPSSLPLACGRPDGTGRPWAHPPGFAPRRPRADNARRGGDRSSSTDLELHAQLTSVDLHPVVHSLRATSCRTSPLRSSALALCR
jgi:hypothetical protein